MSGLCGGKTGAYFPGVEFCPILSRRTANGHNHKAFMYASIYRVSMAMPHCLLLDGDLRDARRHARVHRFLERY